MAIKKPIEISFEFFPPKTAEAQELLFEAAFKLARAKPKFFSVTFGAGGSTRTGTIETLKRLQQQHKNISVAPHLSCIGESHEDLLQLIKTYKNLGVKRIVALRGDSPERLNDEGHGLKFASELVAFIRQATGDHFHIEVAAYPEIHPQARSVQDDILNLKRKQDAGASSAITQYFFNPDAYFYFLDECGRQGIQIPIIPGIMPIAQFSSLARFSDACGAEIPRWIRKRLESYGDDLVSIQQFGLEVVYDLCQTLSTAVSGFHFYTLNKAALTWDLLEMLGLTNSNKTNKMSA